MPAELVDQNIVITANQFNPIILRESWLIDVGVVRAAEFGDGCVFTPAFVVVKSDSFELLAIEDRVQWTLKGPIDAQRELIAVERLRLLLKRLPETPYAAIGLNVRFAVQAAGDFGEYSRRLCFKPTPLSQQFDDEDALFGIYMSKTFGPSRLKLDVKPTIPHTMDPATGTLIPPEGDQTERMVFNFNFHRNIGIDSENRVAEIMELLTMLTRAREHANELVILAGD